MAILKKQTRGREKPLKSIVVALDDDSLELAEKLGSGSLSLGIRRAIAIATLRESRSSRGAEGQWWGNLSD